MVLAIALFGGEDDIHGVRQGAPEGAVTFYLYGKTRLQQGVAERGDGLAQRLPAGDDNEMSGALALWIAGLYPDMLQDMGERLRGIAFKLRIAKGAGQIATAQTNKYRRPAGVGAFTLEGGEYFLNIEALTIPLRWGAFRVVAEHGFLHYLLRFNFCPIAQKTMADIRFYHLTQTPLDVGLYQLMQRTLAAGMKALVRCRTQECMEHLNQRLWMVDEAGFLPHGSDAEPRPERQPVFLTTGESNPNAATLLAVVEDAPMPDKEAFARVLYLFEEQDSERLQKARERWKELKAGGEGLSYWQQGANGGWQQKA